MPAFNLILVTAFLGISLSLLALLTASLAGHVVDAWHRAFSVSKVAVP